MYSLLVESYSARENASNMLAKRIVILLTVLQSLVLYERRIITA
jgi:hypothetical protein